MKDTPLSGFAAIVAKSAQNAVKVNIGGTEYPINTASRRVNDEAIIAAFAYHRTYLVEAMNDAAPFVATDKEDADNARNVSRVHGISFQTMRDYRCFLKAANTAKEFRAIACIMNEDGTLFADTPETVALVVDAFEYDPTIFEAINTAAKWPEFDDRERVRLEALAKTAKLDVVAGSGEESPNG